MAISLIKDYADPFASINSIPLWWDDASYIRYQADDGPQGEWIHELGFLPGHAPVIRRWVWFDEPVVSLSREIRRGFARFGEIAALYASSPEDAALADVFPF